MAISSAIVKLKSGTLDNIQRELKEMSGVDIETITPQGELIIVVEAKNLKTLHKVCTSIEKLDGVLGLYPCYVTTEDEAEIC